MKISLKKKPLKSISDSGWIVVPSLEPCFVRVFCPKCVCDCLCVRACFVRSGEKKWVLLGLFLMSRFGHQIRRVPRGPRPPCLVYALRLLLLLAVVAAAAAAPVKHLHSLTSQFYWTTTKKKKIQKKITSWSSRSSFLSSTVSRIPDVPDLTLWKALLVKGSWSVFVFGFPDDMLLLVVARITRDRKS